MFELVFIIILLLFSFTVFQKAIYHFKKYEVLKGVRFTILSIVILIFSIYFTSEIDFNFPDVSAWILASYTAGKLISLILVYTINISRVQENKDYFASIWLNIILMIIAGLSFGIFGGYNLLEPKDYLILDITSYLLLGATLTQLLEIKISRRMNQK